MEGATILNPFKDEEKDPETLKREREEKEEREYVKKIKKEDNFFEIDCETIDGRKCKLRDICKGANATLVVNVASAW